MDELEVRIERLPARRVASVHGYGQQPEYQAWQKLEAWAGPRGLRSIAPGTVMAGPGQHQIYGFNNPNPSPGSPNYGYEFWIDVGPDVPLGPDGEATIKDVPGGLYAVTRFEGRGETMPPVWKRLVMWGENSRYRLPDEQCLEKHIRIEGDWLELDLMLPIME